MAVAAGVAPCAVQEGVSVPTLAPARSGFLLRLRFRRTFDGLRFGVRR